MTDRERRLRALADDLCERPDVSDAWTAKHFSDRLFVVEVPSEARLADDVHERLHEYDLREAPEVYELGDGDAGADFAGELADGRRYRFVDVRDRGQLQSYVVD